MFLWLTLTVLHPADSRAEEVLWFDSYDEAVDEAKRTGKPIFLEFRCEP
jgi:hypothetical protein